MRKLIVLKKGGEVVTNRVVSSPEAEQAVIDELKDIYSGGDVQWFKHTCDEKGCTEKEFTPEVRPLPKLEPVEEKPVEVKPKPKKNQPPAVRHGGPNNR